MDTFFKQNEKPSRQYSKKFSWQKKHDRKFNRNTKRALQTNRDHLINASKKNNEKI